ncbi:hypothetical protein [Polaromonas sp. LjRoot131]|uniref:hypothetical protein n=1 Tax=Polaromonas sp. LjRoot131 TaxID=3342262 RepID=UPI003ECD52A4
MVEQTIEKPEAPGGVQGKAAEGGGLTAELEAIASRRAFVYADGKGPEESWGLALSGGGIRSATFCLGVLQALAKAPFNVPAEKNGPEPKAPQPPSAGAWPLLARFDFLSTVSGGGYTGGFFSALFRAREPQQPSQPASAPTPAPTPVELANEAYAALATDPPGRLSKVRTSLTCTPPATPDRPLRWLRENGRYLAPNNTGDLFYDVAIAIRNLCAVHYVMGVTLLAVFLLMFALRFASLQIPFDALSHAGAGLERFMQPALPLKDFRVWYSPWFGVLGAWFLLAVVPCGVAYWLDQDQPTAQADQPIPKPVLAAAALLGLGIAAAWLLWPKAPGIASGLLDVPVPLTLLALMDLALLVSLLVFLAAKYVPWQSPRLFRNRITRWLSNVLTVSWVVGLLALLETAGQTLYLWMAASAPTPGTVFSLAGIVTALVAAIRQFAPLLAQPGKDSWLSRLPLNAILGVVGLALALLLAVAWNCVAAALLLGLQPPAPGPGLIVEAMFTQAGAGLGFTGPLRYVYPAVLMAFCLLATVAAGYFLGFINLSSLQVMYGARLTRAYLGASNKRRFDPAQPKMDVTEADASDDFTREAYYRHNHLGPAHLINVTINATTGTGDQLTQRDRQGLPLAVTPAGITVDGLPWDCRSGHVAGMPPPAKVPRRPPPELSIGQWMGVSGAAFSTGLGRGTSLGQAMLFTLINIRLGWWWNSGKRDAKKLSPLWRNQAYLQRELRARFLGTDGSHWYLSDGGHFENTGVFELLRRRVGFIVCCDCGADPNYGFADLANLMRLARIDFGAEFECVRPADVPRFAPDAERLAPYFANDEAELCSPPGPEGKLSAVADDKCALLYRVQYAGSTDESILLVLKPRLIRSAPLDLFQYQARNPSFPQQTTFDQFFDEAQWESYRKLGVLIGSRIFQ